ncbi:hypothetical protein T440DRAFT_389377 [Plenodomus tracheiphilus IPT5]|uniref:Uncharacterized protein n=1 Tax=Plenodomus tracheiphilus IPT5 TaxID=1408161 RepID=A0A6A7BI47_9PLEO|nr:hypothetical protein T440DRAFT_389377 [Plenodomus tracheiphilus IPT5]
MASTHSRSASDESNHAAMAYILEHVLEYPGSYDFPLKTMWELNRLDRAQTLPKSENASPVTGQFAWSNSETAAMNFQASLMNQLKSLPTRTSSLPPTFINNFVGRIFAPQLHLVDWHQTLTALDYLKDLETRRRKETYAAFERLNIHQETWATDMAFIAEKFPGIALWINNIEGKNRKAETYYAVIWTGLRRWIMINELSEQPFNKLACLSMLNTLFPPIHGQTKLPSSYLSLETLKDERTKFFDLIGRVQKHGPEVLRPLMNEHKGLADTTGWPTVQKTLDKYLRVALNMIQDCIATVGPESFDRYATVYGKESKHDSGVSFGSERRPSVGSTLHETQVLEPVNNVAPAPKALSKLERITREFKRMRVKPRPEVEEIIHISQRPADVTPQATDVPVAGKKSLKKARSLASLRFGNSSSMSLASRKGSDAVLFDAEQMKKHRELYESSLKNTTSPV